MNITLTAQPGKCFLLFLTDTVLGSASARWTACGSLQVIRKTRWLASELGGRPSYVAVCGGAGQCARSLEGGLFGTSGKRLNSP